MNKLIKMSLKTKMLSTTNMAMYMPQNRIHLNHNLIHIREKWVNLHPIKTKLRQVKSRFPITKMK